MGRFARALTMRAISVSIGIVLSFLLLEGCLRVLWEPDNPGGMTRKHPTRGYQLRPGYSGHTYQARLEINSRGERGAEREVSFDPDVLRVVVLGDSMVYGVGVEGDETFPAVLETLLNARRSGHVQVFNLGVPSYNTEDQRLYLLESYNTYKPHFVILQYMYGNDAVFKKRPIPQTGWRGFAVWQALREIPPGSWAYHWLVRIVKRIHFVITAAELPTTGHDRLRARTSNMLEEVYADDARGWLEVQDALAGIADFCADHGIGLIAGIYLDDAHLDPHSREILEAAVTKITRAAQSRGIKNVIVLDDAWQGYAGREEILWVTPEDRHWSPLGHERVAVLVSDYLTEHEEFLTPVRNSP